MAAWFSSGRIVDAILLLVALEAILLLALRLRTGRGPAPFPMLCNLGSGAALMLALRAALVGADWPVVAACMLAALATHLGDLASRLRDRRSPILGRASAAVGTSVPAPAFNGRPRI